MARNDYFSGAESKKGPMQSPCPPANIFNFSVYYHAKLQTITETHIQTRKLRAISVFISYPPFFNSIFRQANTPFSQNQQNAIEGFNRQLRKVTKSKTVFPTDDSLLKMLYLAMIDITKKWTGHRQDWGQIHSQLEIYFEERLSGRNL